MSEPPTPHTLTAADVQTLRGSISYRGSSDGTHLAVPFIVYLPADDAFALHAYGGTQAASPDILVLAACLRQERAEPGFIRRILDPAQPCDVASLDPAALLRYHARQRAEALKRASYAAEQDAALTRRAAALNVGRLSLDDL